MNETENAALRAEVAAKDRQLHCMELRAKSAEAIAGMSGVDITRPACDCCEHSGPTVKYHDAAGYLCDKCEPKVMSARESVKRHLDREAELEAEVARLTADNRRLTRAFEVVSEGCRNRIEDIKALEQQLAVTTERLVAATCFHFGSGTSYEKVVIRFEHDVKEWRVMRGLESLSDKWWKTFDEAYQAAIAQGWLPAGEAKGVGG